MNLTFPKLKWPFTEDRLKDLQRFIDQTRDVFANRISYGTNMDSLVVTFEFTAGSVPSKRVDVTTRPLGVLPLSLQKIDPASAAVVTVSDAFSWTYADGSLSFPSWGTLTGTARYRATVLVMRS